MPDVTEAVDFLRQANDAESENRNLGLQDLQFRFGDQWPNYAVSSRGNDRPKLTINEIDAFIRQVCNQQRQQRPRIKVQPVDDFADPKIAKVITGLTRHIEVNSDADHAYDTAFDFAATIGWGYWRVRTDYISEDSFNQDIYIDCIDNPFTVYFDPNSKLPDGSDAEKALVTDLTRKDAFRVLYPGAQDTGFTERGTGDSDADWVTQHDIRLAEFFRIDRVKQKLVMLSDGTVVWADEIPKIQRMLQMAGIGIKGDRDSHRRTVKWCKQTCYEILEEKTLPGRWIPVVPVYWTRVQIDNKTMMQGMVRNGRDPQIMNNFWQTAVTEYLALAPKAKWLMVEGQDEGHEKEFQQANTSASPTLRYKQKDIEGNPAPPPERIAPEPPPAGLIQATMMAHENLQRVMGMFDPAVRSQQEKSGKAILAENNQSEISNFNGYDNLTRSIKHTGRIILSYVPTTYDTKRVQRIIGEDGRDELVTLNEPGQKPDETGQAIDTVLNDVTVGEYDVVMETGPGYDTKRQEGVATMIQLMGTPIGEIVAKVGADIMIRQMDAPGMDQLADRVAASNPMSQIDEKSDIPPKVQMAVKSMQQQIQELTQVIQQMEMEKKYRLDAVRMKDEGDTRRELMRQTSDAHEREITQAQKQHDTEVYALTAQNVAEINGIVQLLKSGTEHGNRMREMLGQFNHEVEMRNAEQQNKASQTETV